MFKNYCKGFLYNILSLLIITFIVTLLNYINIFNIKIVNIFSYITPLISYLIGGLIIGRKCKNKAIIEGLKFGFINVLIMLLFIILVYKTGFNICNIIFYIEIILSSILGCIISKNKNSDN